MTAREIDRRQLKAETKELLRSAQVNPKAFVALYLVLLVVLDVADTMASGASIGLLGTFVTVLTSLMGTILSAGFVLYCMTIRQGQRAEFLTLFDGFSMVGKIIGLSIVTFVFTFLWSMLFVIPGLIASYRYRFAMYNLLENPDLGILEALDMSKRQTFGYKGQLFMLDLSYLGWGLLATLPMLADLLYTYSALLRDPSLYLSDPTLLASTAASTVLISLVSWLWSLVVQLFYLPAYQCVELGYFEIAKETSGVGVGAPPPQDQGWGGWNNGQNGPSSPDDLGGY